MIGIILVTHGALAEALARTAEGISGAQTGLVPLGLAEDEAPESFRRRVAGAVAAFQAALFLADLAGGAPEQAARAVLAGLPPGRDGAVVSGASLPMLLEALFARDDARSVADLAQRVAGAGRDAIRVHGSDELHG